MIPLPLPMIWGTYMKLVTKYQISAINSCWEKCAYMFNVDKNQLSRQTGSRNLMVPSIVAEKNVTKNILEGRTDRGKTVYPPPPSGTGGIIRSKIGSKRVDLILIRLAKCWIIIFLQNFVYDYTVKMASIYTILVHCRSIWVICVRGLETREKARLRRAFSRVSRRIHIFTYMLRQCTCIVFLLQF